MKIHALSLIRLLSFSGVLFRGFVICVLLSGCDTGGASRSEPPKATPPAVDVLVVKPVERMLSREITGRTLPYRIAEVRPRVSGIITDRLFAEGTDVTAGEVLYLIDDAPYRSVYENADAAMHKAGADLKPLRLKRDRYKELLATRAVSRQEYDDADAALVRAQAEYASQKAQVESAHIRYAYTRVTAPIAGRIGLSAVTVGALVTENQSSMLTTIQQLDPLYVTMHLSASELASIRHMIASGQVKEGTFGKVRLFFDDGTPYAQEGQIDFTDAAVDAGTGMVTLRATLANPDRELLPNMVLRVELLEGILPAVIVVPQQAVRISAGGGASVYVVGEGDRAEERAVVLSGTSGDDWQIVSGLRSGDKVIVNGQRKVSPGQPVRIETSREGA